MPSGIGYGAMQGLDQILAQRFLEQQTKAQAAQQAALMAQRQQDLDLRAKDMENDQNWRMADVGLRTTAIAQQAAETPQARTFTINGRIVRENPDGGFEEVYAAPPEPKDPERPMLVSPGQAVFDPTERKTVFSLPGRPTAQQGLSPNQELLAINRLSKQWSDSTKNASEIGRQVNNMDLGLQAARNGNVAAGAQAVLVTFQKILDPTSVVRESEYARSAAGQSALNQAQGFMERLAKGGVGVPVDELEAFANLARQMAQSAQSGLKGRRARLERTATSYGLDPSLVFDDTVPTDDTAQPTPQATPTQTQPTRPSAQDLINKYRGRR